MEEEGEKEGRRERREQRGDGEKGVELQHRDKNSRAEARSPPQHHVRGQPRLLPEPPQLPKRPSWGNCPGVLRPHASICPFGRSNNSQCPYSCSGGGLTGCSASTPTTSIPAHPLLLPPHLPHLPPFLHPPSFSCPPSLRAPSDGSPLGAKRPSYAAFVRFGGREAAATFCPAAGARGASAATGGAWGVRAAAGSHDLLHRSASVRNLQRRAATAGRSGPRPRPPTQPQTQTPGPRALPSLN